MARLYLIRHAKAGERRGWTGDDIDRPLSKKGRKQAVLVGARLAKIPATALYSSPYARCIQTLEPLGRTLGLDIAIDKRLGEDEPFEPLLELLTDAPAGSALCSHGDLIPATLDALVRRGADLTTHPDWRKATTWVLERNKHGHVVTAKVWPPPVI